MPADLIIYALVAAGLVFWLKSILGTRHGEERDRPNPFTNPPPEKAKPLVPLSDNEPSVPGMIDAGGPSLALPRNVSVEPPAQDGMAALMDKDDHFDPGAFVLAAQDAFVIIVEAFARGDRQTLKNLLTDTVYNSFEPAITLRDRSGETVSTEIHAVRRADILDIRFERSLAFITIRFIADETCVVKSREGQILSGHPDRITEMNDIWTFSRDLKSNDPRWLVSETRDGDVAEDHKTQMPDAG